MNCRVSVAYQMCGCKTQQSYQYSLQRRVYQYSLQPGSRSETPAVVVVHSRSMGHRYCCVTGVEGLVYGVYQYSLLWHSSLVELPVVVFL